MDIKAGIYTSEFWVSVLNGLLLYFLNISGIKLDPTVVHSIAIVLVGYIASRFLVKREAMKNPPPQQVTPPSYTLEVKPVQQ